MTERSKKKMKIVSSLVMCILSLFSGITLSLSWFAKNREVTGTGMRLSIDGSGLLLGWECYSVVTDTEGDNFYFEKISNDDAKLGTYKLLENKYQLLVKLCFQIDIDTVTVTAKTSTDYFQGDGEDERHFLLDGDGKYNGETKDYVNSLCGVVSLSTLTGEVKTDSENYDCYIENLPTDTAVFVDDTKNTGAKILPEITIGSNIVTIDGTIKLSDGTDEKCKVVYLLMSYDRDLIAKVFSANLGNPNISGVVGTGSVVPSVPFDCDFGISVKEG